MIAITLWFKDKLELSACRQKSHYRGQLVDNGILIDKEGMNLLRTFSVSAVIQLRLPRANKQQCH